MARLILLNKPYNVLSQFTDPEHRPTLGSFLPVKGVYPAGRLDKDTEGLILLTDDGRLQHRLSHPRHKTAKTYWVQVEGEIDEEALARLTAGVSLKDGPARAVRARKIPQPDLWPRDPPIRTRRHIPDSWLELTLREGRNRQVRRMTAAAGFPALRLIRWRVGDWSLAGLQPGEYREVRV